MRRFTTAFSAAALALMMTLGVYGTTALAVAGYDSAYQFESAFLTLKPGDSGTFSVFFANTGATSWVAGTGTQVNLDICAADKVTCGVTSAQASWASNWLSSTAYATHTKSVVVPGDFSAFTYNVKVPAGTAAGTYRFNGDLALSSTGNRLHPEGYFQDATVSAGAGAAALTVTPSYSTDETNEASTTIPGNGQHTYTFQVTGLTGTVNITTLSASNISRNSDGTFTFRDRNGDKKADGVCPTAVMITAVNGASVTATGCVVNQAIPTSGTITVTVDSSDRTARYRVVMWQDLSSNGQIDLSTAGSAATTTAAEVNGNYDATTDGQIAVSGRKFWMGPNGSFGSQFQGNTVSCDAGASPVPAGVSNSALVYRHDSANQIFDAGVTSATSNRFYYDTNDVFRAGGVLITLAQFKSELTADPTSPSADAVAISYNPDPAGISEFNITCNHNPDAPDSAHTTTAYNATNGGVTNAFAIGDGGSDPTATVGDFDSGGTADDVQIQFTTPDFGSTFQIQRADAKVCSTSTPCFGNTTTVAGTTATVTTGFSCNSSDVLSASYSTVGSITPAGSVGTFTDFDRTPTKQYCYRVRVQDAVTGAERFSVIVPLTLTGASADAVKPISTATTMTPSSGGLANTLDNGDKISITFNEAMSISASAVIRVTDSDCGTAQNNGPAPCTGGTSNTVADIICGSNASCSLTGNTLAITMTGNPATVAAGSVTGAQFPLVVTDSSGITDLAGNVWDISCDGQTGTPLTAGTCGTPVAAPHRTIP